MFVLVFSMTYHIRVEKVLHLSPTITNWQIIFMYFDEEKINLYVN